MEPVPRSKTRVWHLEHALTACLAARDGHSDTEIAELIGIARKTLRQWKEDHPILASAIARGRELCNKTQGEEESFREYVYNHLPENLRELWDEINACEMKRNGVERIKALLKDKGKRTRQHLFLYALTHSNFNASKALRTVGLSKNVLDMWMDTDPEFKELVDQIHWHKGNFFEEGLVGQCRKQVLPAILFANARFNRDRGYGDKVQVEVTGQVNHLHAHISLEDLDEFLSFEVKASILEAVRKKEKRDAITLDSELNTEEATDGEGSSESE